MPRNNLVFLNRSNIINFFSPFYLSTKSRLVHASGKSFFSFPSCETFSFQRIPPSRNGTRIRLKYAYNVAHFLRGTAEKQDNRDTFLTECITRADLSRWFIFMLLSGRKLEGERKGRRFVRSQVIKKSSLVLCLNFSGGRGCTRRKGRKSRNRDKICRQFPFLI